MTAAALSRAAAGLLAVFAVGAESLVLPDWPMFTETLLPISAFQSVAPILLKSKVKPLIFSEGIGLLPRVPPGTYSNTM